MTSQTPSKSSGVEAGITNIVTNGDMAAGPGWVGVYSNGITSYREPAGGVVSVDNGSYRVNILKPANVGSTTPGATGSTSANAKSPIDVRQKSIRVYRWRRTA